ncbi:RNA polymerase II-associated [Schizophyllum commune]
MSSEKAVRYDLLVRVRYSNPLPPPPCPPKLLNIPTNPKRYAKPEFLDALRQRTPVPMVVDAECGMPLDLSQWDGLWEPEGNDAALNPDPLDLPLLDDKDRELLWEPPGGPNRAAEAAVPTNVTWLRKKESIARQSAMTAQKPAKKRAIPTAVVDVSREAQLRDIEASFAAANEDFVLEEVKHPTKKGVTAVESYEFLPDPVLWANQYDLFRFMERPGNRPPEDEDPRLACAVLRPMKSEVDTFLSYYLTENDDAALSFIDARISVPPYEVPPNSYTKFDFVRDYETTKVEQDITNEFVLNVDDGDDFDDVKPGQQSRGKGAYYKNVERKMTLNKRRANPYDNPDDRWDVIHLTHAELVGDELRERDEALLDVTDPNYYLVPRDGEGEVDEDLDVAMGGMASGSGQHANGHSGDGDVHMNGGSEHYANGGDAPSPPKGEET